VSDENWGVTFTPRARRDLRALDPQVRDRVLGVIGGIELRPEIRRWTFAD